MQQMMDTSPYKYLFKNAHPFSYDLEELATHYIEFHRPMAHHVSAH